MVNAENPKKLLINLSQLYNKKMLDLWPYWAYSGISMSGNWWMYFSLQVKGKQNPQSTKQLQKEDLKQLNTHLWFLKNYLAT